MRVEHLVKLKLPCGHEVLLLWGEGFGVWVVGFGTEGLGFGTEGLGFGFYVVRFRVLV